MTPEICPNCGAEVPKRAKACPECGADEATGWSEDASYGGLDLPDDSFNYDEFVEREFGGKQVKPHRVKWLWCVVAIVLVLFFAGIFRFIF